MNNSNPSVNLKKEILIRIVNAFFSEDFQKNIRLIPYDMRPKGSEVPYRCCIYKERAILKDRIIAGLGFSIEEDDERTLLSEFVDEAIKREKPEENILTVLDAACKGCSGGRITVTDLCNGCVARPCETTCRFNAVSIVNGHCIIDSERCRRCKKCISVCPYSAIVQIKVPCEDACPTGAIAKNELGLAKIDFSKCISCGKCVSKCPFAAVHEKSQLIDIMKHIKSGREVVAMIAPSIAGQMNSNIYQIKTALIQGGFTDVFEVASGADITIRKEAKEFEERMERNEPFMTTSCCAGYNELVKKHIPELKEYVSNTKTPIYYTAELVKARYPNAITVFISPCAAKRAEIKENSNINYLMNYEELEAYLKGRNINVAGCKETLFEKESSKQGRNFGAAGGVAEAVKKALTDESKVNPCYINGIDKDSIKKLKRYGKEKRCDNGNLIEVMCCEGGCLGGNATLLPLEKSAKILAEFIKSSKDIEKNEE